MEMKALAYNETTATATTKWFNRRLTAIDSAAFLRGNGVN